MYINIQPKEDLEADIIQSKMSKKKNRKDEVVHDVAEGGALSADIETGNR
jgi:hypothetical protein